MSKLLNRTSSERSLQRKPNYGGHQQPLGCGSPWGVRLAGGGRRRRGNCETFRDFRSPRWKECVLSFQTHSFAPELSHSSYSDDPSAPPVLICKIRKGQELRVRCIAKKVMLASTMTKACAALSMHVLGYSKGTREVVPVRSGLLRIRPTQPPAAHDILVRNRHQKRMAIKCKRSGRRSSSRRRAIRLYRKTAKILLRGGDGRQFRAAGSRHEGKSQDCSPRWWW
jgi:hypothetical protein